MSSITPSSFVKEYGPWSVSKANTAKECPYKFYLTYVEKRKEGRLTNPDALVGNAVHSILEYMLTGRSWPMAFEGVVDEYSLTSNEIERVASMQFAVLDFIERLAVSKRKFNIKQTQVEQKLAVDIDGNKVGFFNNEKGFLRGVIDLALIAKDPVVILIDHKTGKVRDISYYRRQFEVYMILAKALNPHITRAKYGVHYLQESDTFFAKGTEDISDITPLMEGITKFLNDCTVDTHNFKETRKSRLCDWCDHRAHCPAYKGSDSDHGKQKVIQQ